MDTILDWAINSPSGKATVVVIQGIASYELAHQGVTGTWGVTIHADPTKLTLGFLWVIHRFWAAYRHHLIQP